MGERNVERESSIYLRVWLPGKQPGVHAHLLTIENEDALFFFLDALSQGNKTFFEKPFDVVAYDSLRTVGTGNYTIKEKRAKKALTVHYETGMLKSFMKIAWKNVLDGSMPPTLNHLYHPVSSS